MEALKPKLSIIIPHYPLNEDLNRKLDICRKSLGKIDELILVVNNGIGFPAAVNWGLKMASGDFLAVVSNDVVTNGDVSQLCDINSVTCPKVNDGNSKFYGCFFVLPRWVYEKIGGLDEQFGMGYFEDDDYIKRLEQNGIPIKIIQNVSAVTMGGQTMQFFDKRKIMRENQLKFKNKWQ